MIWALSWIVAVELLSLAALPAATRLLRSLPDRGYLFAKPLGVLVVAYLCWLLGIFGLLRFQQATIAAVLVAVAVGCWVVWGRETLRQLAGMPATLVASEALFLVAFAVASLIRAYNPEISGTEKPMDFALLNAIYRSEVFPPQDPWMSGFSISYYYFGYLLLAMVTKLSGIPASVGYNLGVAVVFALLLAGGFSLGFNLLSLLIPRAPLYGRLAGALAAPLLLGVMGNLEIGFEVLAVRGFGDNEFWKWVGIKGLQPASAPQEGWFPTSHWWWWRASRVIPTTKPDGINEFPYFSFLLGDLHPHYTALPWALLAVALALAALLRPWKGESQPSDDRLSVAVASLCLGFFMVGNSWDFPTYTGLFWVASIVAVSYQQSAFSHQLSATGWPMSALRTELKRLLLTSALSVLLYSPFMLGFSSQVRGIGLSEDKTPLISLLIIFGPFLLILAALLAWWAWPAAAAARGWGSGDRETPRRADAGNRCQSPDTSHQETTGLDSALRTQDQALSTLRSASGTQSSVANPRPLVRWVLWGAGSLLILGAPLLGAIALLVGLLVLAAGAALTLLPSRGEREPDAETRGGGDAETTALTPTLSQGERGRIETVSAWEMENLETPRPPVSASPRLHAPLAPAAFLLLLIVAGLLLVLGPELVFLNDSFGTRMNTVFKFHYQAWVLLGLASSVGLAWMAAKVRPLPIRGLVVVAAVLPVSVGLLYPLGATFAKANGFKASPTLDGAAFYQSIRPEDYAAMRWLSAATTGQPVVLEATGGEYSEYARVSTFTGLPTVLGWAGHELQWRGKGEEPARRAQDIDTLYKTADRAALLGLLDKYRVQYVFVGSLEYERYGQEVGNRFEGLLETVHRQGRVVIYRRIP